MDAVEFPYPVVDVAAAAAPKLMGAVPVKELEACESDRDSVIVSPSSIECCSSFLSEKAAAHAISSSELVSWDKILDPGSRKQDKQLPRNQGEASSGVFHDRCKNGLLLTPKVEGVQLEQKAGKASRSNSLCSKRPRVIQLQYPPLAGVDGIKDVSQKLGSCSLKCTSSVHADKTQLARQKNNFSKRGDKRSLRVPVKNKYDSFSVKAGITNFGSAAGGNNNFFGVYGLKSDNHDVTKLIEDLPLNELLCGNYESPSLGKDKGKKAAIGTESFLQSVHKACSTLQPPRSVQSQNNGETDSCLSKKMSLWLLSSVSAEASGINGDTGDSSPIDVSSSKKDACIKSETRANPLDLPLYQPLDILQRLGLPPPKDLESLLLDAAKPAVSSKNTPEMRSVKQIARRVSLPPFPWSHTSSGHCRASSDVVKLSTSKGTCQGRWQRTGKNITNALDITTSNLTDLESLTYDQNLVPSGLVVARLDHEISPQISGCLTGCAWDSLASCSKGPSVSLGNAESGGKTNHPGNAGHCPKLLAAAQTLYDIATRPPRQNLDRMLRWPKKSSQKAMKARKLKSTEKSEEPHAMSVSIPRSENLGRSEEIIPPKRPKLSHFNNKRDFNHIRREAVNWSAPRSSRSSPGKTIKDSLADTRHTTANIVKQSCMMPPPPLRVSENASNGQPKLRRLMPFEWNR